MSDNQHGKHQASPQQFSSQQETYSQVDAEKRKFLIATSAVGAIGVAAVAVPFVKSMTPSERAKAAGAPVEVAAPQCAEGDSEN